jgi:hypothetical protein
MRALRRLLVLAAVLVAGCADGYPAGSRAPGGDGGSGGAGGTGAGGSGGTIAWPDVLVGHWVDEQIGDCIHAYDWLSFAPTHELTRTLVDDNTCAAPSLERRTGAWMDGELDILWTRVTDELEEGHATVVAGDGGPYLDRRAYVAQADGYLHFHRRVAAALWPSDEEVTVRVRFEPEDAPATAPANCRATLSLEVRARATGDAAFESGEDAVVLPCAFADAGPGLRELALGTGGWGDVPDFEARHPAAVAAAMRAAFPRAFVYPQDDPAVLASTSAAGAYRWFRWSEVPPG